VNAEFFALAFSAALNPKLLAIDLLLIENRRPRAMFLCAVARGDPGRAGCAGRSVRKTVGTAGFEPANPDQGVACYIERFSPNMITSVLVRVAGSLSWRRPVAVGTG
jgi:hypothetical protein